MEDDEDDTETDTTQSEATQAAENTSPTPDEVSSALEAKVQAGFESMKEDSVPEQREEDTTSTDAPAKEDVVVAPEQSTVTTIPAGHQRAAMAQGWSQEEIDHLAETDPDKARTEFSGIFSDWQETSSKWAKQGREDAARREAEAEGTTPPSVDTPTASVLKGVDVDEYIEKYGNEELVRAMAGPINEQMAELNALADRLQVSEQYVHHAQQDSLMQATEEFFARGSMQTFHEHYGTDPHNLTDVQLDNRKQLFEESDMLVAGAASHGQKLTVADALERSHAFVTQESQRTTVLDEVRASIQKRTISTPGIGVTGTTPEGGVLTDSQLEARVAATHRRIFGK